MVTLPVSKDFFDFEEAMTQPIPRSCVTWSELFQILMPDSPLFFYSALIARIVNFYSQ